MFNLLRIWVWPLWLLFALALSVPLFTQELDPRTGHPPGKLAGLIFLVAAMGAWIWLRRKFARAELWMLIAAVLIPAILWEPKATITMLAISAAAFAFGRCACDWLRLPMNGRVEEIVASAGLGFGAWVIILVALGAARMLSAFTIAAALIVILAPCRRGLVRLFHCAVEGNNQWNEAGLLTGIQTFAVLAMIGSMHLVMLTPTLYYDAFATHLAAANYYVLHHVAGPVPFMSYSGFPQGFELAMAGAGSFAGQAGERMVSPLFLLLTLPALYAFAKELGASRGVAAAGAIFGVALPFIQWTGSSVKNDLMLAFFLISSLLAALRYANTGASGWLYATAFLAAVAQNVKLSAVIATGPLAILLFAASARLAGGLNAARWRSIAIALGLFLVFSSYWPLRDQVIFGSAIYPLNVPAGQASGAVANLTAGRSVKLATFVSLPWKLQIHGNWGFDGQNDSPLGLFFLLFVPAILWMRRGDWSPPAIACLFFVTCYFLTWGFTVPILRYATVPIAMLALGLSAGLERTCRATSGWLRIFLLATVVYCNVYNWSVMATLGVRIQRIELLAGRMSTDAFLRIMLPLYPSADWIRTHAQPGESTLSVGNYALAYMGDPGLVNVILLEEGPFPVSTIRRELEQRPYRYLLLPVSVDPEQVFAGRSAAPKLESLDERYRVFRME